MLIYLFIFFAFSALAVFPIWRPHDRWVPSLIWLFLTVFIGYRYWIGVDWPTYATIFRDDGNLPLFAALQSGDAGYSLINWVVNRLGGDVWHVNLICAAIFSYGLIVFCNDLQRPDVAFIVAIPTLIIVTGMGYTRQAVAIGCLMLAYRNFKGEISWRWLLWLVAALLFHKSAIFALPLFIFSGSRNRILIGITGIVLGAIFVDTIIARSFSNLISIYIEGDLESSGTLPRVLIGALAGLCFFLIKNKDEILGQRKTLLRNACIVMITLPILLAVIPSTIVDRIGVLFLPFQSAALSALVYSHRSKPIQSALISFAIIGISAAVLIVWLLFATFATYWIPYQNVMFVRWPTA